MVGSEDKLKALHDVEERVCGRLKDGTPRRLARVLFKDLQSVAPSDEMSGGTRSRENAASEVLKLAKDTAFKSAINTIAEKLQQCRDGDTPPEHDRVGTTCIKCSIAGEPYWLVVRGPAAVHRGVMEDSVLRLSARFLPITTAGMPSIIRISSMRVVFQVRRTRLEWRISGPTSTQ